MTFNKNTVEIDEMKNIQDNFIDKEQDTLGVIFGLFSEVNKFWSKIV